MFTPEAKQILLELIYNEQINLINKNEYESEKYTKLEELKIKIRTV